MNRLLDLKALIHEGVEALKKYNSLAVPGIIADLAVLPVLIALRNPMEDLRMLIVLVLANMSLSFFAFGTTTAMAREYTERGRTSLNTAAFIAKRLAPTLLALSLLCPLVVLTGIIMYVLPGMIAGCFLMYAIPSVIADGLGPYEAIAQSIAMVRGNLAVSARLFAAIVLSAMLFGVFGMFISLIPVLGLLANLVLQGAYMAVVSIVLFRAYKTLKKPVEPVADDDGE